MHQKCDITPIARLKMRQSFSDFALRNHVMGQILTYCASHFATMVVFFNLMHHPLHSDAFSFFIFRSNPGGTFSSPMMTKPKHPY